jgi:hypothetical protein
MLTRSKAGNRVVCGRVFVLKITGVKQIFFVVNYLLLLLSLSLFFSPSAFLTGQDIMGLVLIEQ